MVCIEDTEDPEIVCPVTDLSLEEPTENLDLYELRERNGAKIWISKKIVGHPIEEVTIQPGLPCLDQTYFNAVSDQ